MASEIIAVETLNCCSLLFSKPRKQVSNENGEQSSEITFGTGSITGDFYEDHLCIGGSLCAHVRFIGASSQSASPFASTPFDGILGLGFKDLSMGNDFNILDDMFSTGALPGGKFSVFLTEDGSSEITFGGFKENSLASDVVWAPVTHQSYWQVQVEDIAINNADSGLCKGSCQVAVDTGTSMLAGPSSLVSKLSGKVNAAEDCSNYDQLPNIGFRIGNKILNLKPEDYMDRESGSCSFSLMPLDVPPPRGPLFIFGDPFLRRFVTIYDKEGPSVGFAVSKQSVLDSVHASQIIFTTNHAPRQDFSIHSEDSHLDTSIRVGLSAGYMAGEGPSEEAKLSEESSRTESLHSKDPFSNSHNDWFSKLSFDDSVISKNKSESDDSLVVFDSYFKSEDGYKKKKPTEHESSEISSDWARRMKKLLDGNLVQKSTSAQPPLQKQFLGSVHKKGTQLISVKLHKAE